MFGSGRDLGAGFALPSPIAAQLKPLFNPNQNQRPTSQQRNDKMTDA